MSLRSKKRKVYSLQGTYETRMWNDEVDIHYFHKKRGGEYFLKKCLDEARSKDIIFNSSLVNSKQGKPWLRAGWRVSSTLYLYTYLFTKPLTNNSKSRNFEVEKLDQDSFEEIVSLDKEIFNPYWRSSSLSLLDTLRSCNDTTLYTHKKKGRLLAYAIVGVTMRSSFLQRFAVHPEVQGVGLGTSMLDNVLIDMNEKKMISIKLNTQPNNKTAQKLYENKGFFLSNQELLVMTSE